MRRGGGARSGIVLAASRRLRGSALWSSNLDTMHANKPYIMTDAELGGIANTPRSNLQMTGQSANRLSYRLSGTLRPILKALLDRLLADCDEMAQMSLGWLGFKPRTASS